jgi:hypothetical protein
VENFGGIVWVERAREGGAALHIFLPLSPTMPAWGATRFAHESWRA